MYSIMYDYIEGTTYYPRRIGKMSTNLDKAIQRAKKHKGYVMCGIRIVWC